MKPRSAHVPRTAASASVLALLALPLGIGPFTLGCGASEMAGEPDYAASPTPGYDPYPEEDGSGEDTPPPLPAESEDAFYRAVPAATDRYVLVVNPERDTLSKINASTRAVYTLPVGLHPTQVEVGLFNPDKALVVNEGDATVSILNVQDDTAVTLPIHPDTNYASLSADGRFAITWFNASVEGASTSVDGVRSYSNISVLFTGEGTKAPTSTPIAVALNPRGVAWVPDADQALVLCDDAVALITLSATPTSRLIPLTSDIDENLQVAELKVGPDGHYAFARLSNLSQLVVIDLKAADPTQAVTRLDLPGIPSDMDLAEDALILVDRANRALRLYDPLDPAQLPRVVSTPENQIVGSVVVAPEQDRAILYTTLTQKDIDNTNVEDIPLNRFSVWDLQTDAITLHELVKPVQEVRLNRTAVNDVATFIHQGSADSEVAAFDNKEALTHFYFSDGLSVPAVLQDPIRSIADTPGGAYEYLILEDNLNVLVVNYQSRQVTAVAVQSQPVFVGILTSSNIGYVSQEHELGRLSFIEPESMSVSTITGFELNAQP